MSRSPTPPRSALKRTGSDAELDQHPSQAPSTRTRATPAPIPPSMDRHSPLLQAEAGPSGTSTLDDPPAYEAGPSLPQPRRHLIDSNPTAEVVDWPDPNIGEFPSDLIVVPLTDPLSVPLSIEPEYNPKLDTHQWCIKHPTKVEIKNLVELEDDPVAILEQVDKRFARMGNIYRLEPKWQDEFGIEVVFHLTYGNARSAREACMLGVVEIPKLECTFSVAPVTYEMEETTLMRRKEYDRLQRLKREDVMRRLSVKTPSRDEGQQGPEEGTSGEGVLA